MWLLIALLVPFMTMGAYVGWDSLTPYHADEQEQALYDAAFYFVAAGAAMAVPSMLGVVIALLVSDRKASTDAAKSKWILLTTLAVQALCYAGFTALVYGISDGWIITNSTAISPEAALWERNFFMERVLINLLYWTPINWCATLVCAALIKLADRFLIKRNGSDQLKESSNNHTDTTSNALEVPNALEIGHQRDNDSHQLEYQPSQALPTACGSSCDCKLGHMLRYEVLTDLIGQKIVINSIETLSQDIFAAIKSPYTIENEANLDNPIYPEQYAAVFWKHRRANVEYPVKDVESCKSAGSQKTYELGLLDLHEERINEIERHGDRLFMELLLLDPEGDASSAPHRTIIKSGEAVLLLKESEAVHYQEAMKVYCANTGKHPDDLKREDGYQWFVTGYLPREFVIADACLSNLPSLLRWKNFVM